MSEIRSKIKVLNIITRLIVGGAQETAIYSCDLIDKDSFDAMILSGPQTGSEGELISVVKKKGIRLEICDQLVRELNPMKDIIALFKLARFIKKGNFSIVHTHSSKAGILGRMAAKIAGAKVIVHTVHGWGHHDMMNSLVKKFYIFLERLVEPFTDILITVSDCAAREGLKDGIGKPEKYLTIRSGIDLDEFKNASVDIKKKKKELGIDPGCLVVGTIGRLSSQKSPQDFFLAAHEILKHRKDIRFLYIGDGPLRSEIEKLIKRLSIEEKVILTGIRKDIAQLLKVMDIFILTSLWEGLPRVFPQAMASGLPVISTNIGGASEAIKEGVTGFLVEPGDYKAIADRCLKLLTDGNMRKDMGIAGAKMVYPDFCDKEMVKRIQRLYEDLLEKKNLNP